MYIRLFRGKRVDNGEWVEGDLIHRVIWSSNVYVIRVEDNGFDKYVEYEVIPETVGQHTELTDENGKRIFEWDIVKYGNNIGYVIYGKGCFSVQDIHSLNRPAIDIIMHGFSLEIIGNIHDNPELLKEGEADV